VPDIAISLGGVLARFRYPRRKLGEVKGISLLYMTLKAKKRVKGVLLLCAGTFPDIVYYGVKDLLRLWTGDATNWV
jgi:hypothetical protein